MKAHLVLRVTVKDGERALLTRDGRLEQVLEPGRHRLLDPLRIESSQRVAGDNNKAYDEIHLVASNGELNYSHSRWTTCRGRK